MGDSYDFVFSPSIPLSLSLRGIFPTYGNEEITPTGQWSSIRVTAKEEMFGERLAEDVYANRTEKQQDEKRKSSCRCKSYCVIIYIGPRVG